MCLLYLSERLNALAGTHWRAFSTQNYFDSKGVFTGVLWAAPLILLQTAMLAGFLYRAAKLLVALKRQQIGKRRPQAAPSEPAKAASGPRTRRAARE